MAERQGDNFVVSDSDPINFTTFVLGLASTTLIHLGEASHPEGGGAVLNLTLAKQTLDLLNLLQEKTRGNLTKDEEQLFVSVLTDLKLRFVRSSQK